MTIYGYDRLNQLTSVQGPGVQTTIAYDPVGNRVSMTSGGTITPSTYDRADRITAGGPYGAQYVVDANGNITADGPDAFGYDAANRLTSLGTHPYAASYVYNGDGTRTSRHVVGAPETNDFRYTYDVNQAQPALLVEDSTTTANTTTTQHRTFVWGPVGVAYVVDSAGNIAVYHTDGLGSVRALTDASGTVTQTYRSDAFGVPVGTESSNPPQQPFSYTGQQHDYELQLVDLGARYYFPAIGRFLSRDPLAGSAAAPLSLNRYAYAGNNPTSATDPSGLLTYFIGGIGGTQDLASYQQFVFELSLAGLHDVRGPITPYSNGEGKIANAGNVITRNLLPGEDTDAQALASQVKSDILQDPLAAGEQLNFIALSGGATTAFNAAAILDTRLIHPDNIVTVGGVVYQIEPGNVGQWTSIVGVFDPLPFIGEGSIPDRILFLPGVSHVQIGPFPGYLNGGAEKPVIKLIVGPNSAVGLR